MRAPRLSGGEKKHLYQYGEDHPINDRLERLDHSTLPKTHSLWRIPRLCNIGIYTEVVVNKLTAQHALCFSSIMDCSDFLAGY